MIRAIRVIPYFENHLHRTYCLRDVSTRRVVEWNLSHDEACEQARSCKNLEMLPQ